MSQPLERANRRILIVDDTLTIHEDFRKILSPQALAEDNLSSAEEALFGAPVAVATQSFVLDSAFQGMEALNKVETALAKGLPYAMAFIDMRMPPGWDGLETIERLWRADPKLQVALCTAYSDYSWEDIADRLELGDRLLILKKPFDAIEIRQMASTLTVKWQMTEDAALKMDMLEQAVEERTRELADANIIVQNSPTILYRLRGEPPFPLMYISHNITKFGHVAAQLVNSPDWAQALIHPDDQSKIDQAMVRVLDRDTAGASIEFRMRTGDGAFRWVENRYIPVRNEQGLLLEVEGIILDITERKLAEEKIALLARTDGLTGLANRATVIERLHQAFAAARRGRRRSRCSTWIWTTSSGSTTPWAIPSATCCCRKSPRASRAAPEKTTWSRAWAATSSPSCNWMSTNQPNAPPWRPRSATPWWRPTPWTATTYGSP
ncbi:protein of unknown function [Pseudomonas mediterranea]